MNQIFQKTGKLSLYLEFYKGIQTLSNGKIRHLRYYEYLQLYLKQNPWSAAEKKKNQEQLELAEQILAIRRAEVYQGKYPERSQSQNRPFGFLRAKERGTVSNQGQLRQLGCRTEAPGGLLSKPHHTQR